MLNQWAEERTELLEAEFDLNVDGMHWTMNMHNWRWTDF